ncbi:MAG: signal peptidase I [Candidatus Hydrogenedentes bacterium]|nr:signal peptidase I [Candidatus Hydrogenedentota bacterium]
MAQEDLHPGRPFMARILVAVLGPMTRGNILGWVFLLGGIFAIKAFIVDQYTIPSGSMEPTLIGDERYFVGDRVLVNKWLVGPRIPFTNFHLWKGYEPKRWDIMVFTPVEKDSPYPRLIKRVVGLPGERIKIELGQILVNGVPVPFPQDMIDRKIYYYNDSDLVWEADVAKTPQDRAYWQAVRERFKLQYGVREEDEFSVVPEGHYLMLGDNSRLSLDGRVYGWVPWEHFIGRACAVFWPWEHRRDFTGFTQTWWGKGLLYGIPVTLILAELALLLYSRKKKREADKPDAMPT